jgi:hypothetical protein
MGKIKILILIDLPWKHQQLPFDPFDSGIQKVQVGPGVQFPTPGSRIPYIKKAETIRKRAKKKKKELN